MMGENRHSSHWQELSRSGLLQRSDLDLGVSGGLQFENRKLSAGVGADACWVGEQATCPGCISEVIATVFVVSSLKKKNHISDYLTRPTSLVTVS